MAKEVSIRFSMDDIFACRVANCVLPLDLEQYCTHIRVTQTSMLTDLVKSMDDITKSHSHGINPNDITLKNMIRDNLNKVSNSNFKIIVNELEKLNYTSENHFVLLVDELILKCMNDVMACKGIDASKTGHLTPSEMYVDIMKQFSQLYIPDESNPVRFKTVLTKVCHAYFEKLTDKNERMDQNNPHRVSNYKGFMNMIGLMYSVGLFPKEIVMRCFNKLLDLIFKSQLQSDDCDNYYSGYERLMNQILNYFEKSSPNAQTFKDFKEISDYLRNINDTVTKSTQADASGKSKTIRMFSVMSHQKNVSRLNKLFEVYAAYSA